MLEATNQALEDAKMGSAESLKRLEGLRQEMLERHEEQLTTHREAQAALPEEVVDGDMLREHVESSKNFTAQARDPNPNPRVSGRACAVNPNPANPANPGPNCRPKSG